jgi:hypothetical protein
MIRLKLDLEKRRHDKGRESSWYETAGMETAIWDLMRSSKTVFTPLIIMVSTGSASRIMYS